MKTTLKVTLFLLLISMPAWAGEPDPARLSVSDAVVEAIHNNPYIHEAAQNMGAARATVQSARAEMLPKISAGYGYTALKETPVMKTAAGEMQVAHQRQYNWAVTLVQPLFAGFALRSQYEISSLDRLARELEKQQAILDLTRQVRSACYHLLLVQQLLMVSDSEVATLSAHKHDTELFYGQGLIPPNDQLKAEVALSNSRQENERIRAEVKKAKIRINRLLNRQLDADLEIDDAAPAGPASFSVDELGQAALQGRPVMRLLGTSLDQLGLAAKVARSAWYPRVSLVGSYGHVGANPAATENDYGNNDESYVGLQVQWDFWQSGKTRAEIGRRRWQLKALESRIEAIEAQVLEEVRSALFDCQVAHRNIATAQKALEQARENWRITDMQYQQQIATSTDVLDARAFLTQADTNYFSAVYGYLDALAGLDRAVGKNVAH